MNVKLISITQSRVDDLILSAEDLIVYIARVSNPANQINTETSDKLISYLVRKKHWSPFEMVDMTVEIKTSRAIAAQILRHRSFSFQEFSQRYAEVTDMEPIQLRKQAATNRQSSEEIFDPSLTIDCGNDMVNNKASITIEDHLDYSQNLYKSLLDAGVAKECARMVLPLTTQSTIYMKGSVRSWIHYLQIRLEQHVQLEHRLVAESIDTIFMLNFPRIHSVLNT